MHVIVAFTSGCDIQAALDAFRSGGCKVADKGAVSAWLDALGSERAANAIAPVVGGGTTVVSVDPSELQAVSAAAPALEQGSRFLLFYSSSEKAVLQAMAEQCSLGDALVAWEDEARSLLDCFYANRDTSGLFAFESLFTEPESITRAFAQRLDLQLGLGKTRRVTEEVRPAEVLRLLAAQTVAQSNKARDLAGELDAASIVAGEGGEIATIDSDLLFQELVNSGLNAHGGSVDVREENELLLLQLQQVQEELEHYYLDLQKETKLRTGLERQLADRATALKKSEDQLKKVSGELQKAKRKFEMMRRSTSWKITLPLRVLVRLFKRSGKRAGTA